jgi:hypothetical protein
MSFWADSILFGQTGLIRQSPAEPKVVATLDYLVFAMANAELLVPEQARIVKETLTQRSLADWSNQVVSARKKGHEV